MAARRAPGAVRGGAAARRPAYRQVGPLARQPGADRAVPLRPAAVLRPPRARPGRAQPEPRPVELDPGRLAPDPDGDAPRPVVDLVRAADHRGRVADPRLLHRLHGARPRPAPVLRVPEPVRGGDAAAGARQQLRRPVLRLGGRRPGVVPADRLVQRPAGGGDRGEEGVHHEPGRRRRPADRDLPDVQDLRDGVVRGRLRLGRHRVDRGRDRARVAAAARRLRQVRPGAAAGLAAGRDGGPDSRLGPHPRGNDGHRRCLPDRPGQPDLRRHRGRTDGRHHRRRGHAAVRLHRGLRVRRHQEGPGVLDGQPDRLHVPGRRSRPRRVRDRHHAPARARLLQGRAVPRCRLGDARHEGPGGHAPFRRALAGHADHLLDDDRRLPRDRRHDPVLRVLHQGQDHRVRVRQGRDVRLDSRDLRAARRGHHRVLHDPADGDDLPRRAAVDRRRAPARVAAGHDRADDHPRVRLGLRRWPAGPQRHLPEVADPVGRRAGGGRRAHDPAGGAHGADAAGGRRRRARRLVRVRSQGGAGARARERHPDHRRRPPRPVRQRVQRGGVHAAGDVAGPVPGVAGQPRCGRSRQRRRGRVRGRVRPAAPAADRLRPLLRPVDAGRVRARRGVPAGSEVRVNDFPILLVLGLVALVGAAVVVALPRGRDLLAKQLTLLFSVATLAITIGLCIGFDDDSADRFQYATSYEWIRSFGVSFALGVDGIALVLIALVAVLVPAVVAASWSERDRDADASAPASAGVRAGGGAAAAVTRSAAGGGSSAAPAGTPAGGTATAVLDPPVQDTSRGSSAVGATRPGQDPGSAFSAPGAPEAADDAAGRSYGARLPGTRRGQPKTFFALLLLLEVMMIGVFAATDVFLFYVFFEAMLIPMYFLIGSFGGPRRQYAAVKFFLYSLLGGLIMLAAVIGLYVVSNSQLGEGTFAFDALRQLEITPGVQKLLFLGFFVAFAIKAPLVPFHTWLPDSGSEAPIGGAVLLVGVLDKMGTFGFLRYCLPLFPDALRFFAPSVLVLAVAGVLYAALLALGQSDMKRLVSYTSISHFGFIALGIFAFTTEAATGAVLYMVNHGIATGLLFVVVGILISRGGSRQIGDYGGVASKAPVLAGVFLLAGLASLALPGTNSFVSEFLVLIGSFPTVPVYTIIATVGIILAALYILLMYQRTMHGPAGGLLLADDAVDGEPAPVATGGATAATATV